MAAPLHTAEWVSELEDEEGSTYPGDRDLALGLSPADLGFELSDEEVQELFFYARLFLRSGGGHKIAPQWQHYDMEAKLHELVKKLLQEKIVWQTWTALPDVSRLPTHSPRVSSSESEPRMSLGETAETRQPKASGQVGASAGDTVLPRKKLIVDLCVSSVFIVLFLVWFTLPLFALACVYLVGTATLNLQYMTRFLQRTRRAMTWEIAHSE